MRLNSWERERRKARIEEGEEGEAVPLNVDMLGG